MEHVPNMFMSFDKYLFLEVINILHLDRYLQQIGILTFGPGHEASAISTSEYTVK